MAEWQRSTDIPFPKIWFKFKAFNHVLKQKQTFTIMDIPEDAHETIISSLQNIHFRETSADQVSIEEREALLRMALKQRLSLMCVLKEAGATQPLKKIVAIGINVRRTPIDIPLEFKGKRMEWLSAIREHIFRKKDFFGDFNVAEVIVSVCAYTYPSVNTTIVSMHMFKCRGFLCKETGIKLTLACCPVGDNQNVKHDAAIKAGYKEYVRIPYEELASIDTTQRIPKCTFFALMYNFSE